MGDCFQIYYDMGQFRSLPDLIKKLNKTHPGQVPSYDTLKRWSKNDEWGLQVRMMDDEIKEGVKKKLVSGWVETKAKMLKVLLDQIDKSVEDGISPTNTKEVVALVHEIRGIMGESDESKNIKTKIEFEFVESTKKE